MKPEVKKHHDVKEFFTTEGCHILEVANDAADNEVSIARARVESGVATKWHLVRDTIERYLIISGKGRVEVEGLAPTDIREGDVVRIPAGTPQRITNTGKTDLIFYCICSPRFRVENYEELNEG